MDNNQQELYIIADRLRSIANLGLTYSDNKFDTERYSEIRELAADLYSKIDGTDNDQIREEFTAHLNHVSPLAGGDAVILKEGSILLIQRHDDKLWATPGGLIEIGETPAEGALRELYEETRITGTVDRLLGVFDSRLWNSGLKQHLYHFVFLVTVEDPHMETTDEALDIGYFDQDHLPPLSPGHDKRLPSIFNMLKQNSHAHCD